MGTSHPDNEFIWALPQNPDELLEVLKAAVAQRRYCELELELLFVEVWSTRTTLLTPLVDS